MGLFENTPQTTDDHLKVIEEKSAKETSTSQKVLAAASGIGSAVVTGATWLGVDMAVDAAQRNSHLFDGITVHHAQKDFVKEGKNFQATARVIDKDKTTALWNAVKEGLKPGNLWQQTKTFAKEHPKYTIAIVGASTALGAISGYGQLLLYKKDNDAQIGDSVRAVRKMYAEAMPEEKERIATQLAGGKWTAKVSAETPSSKEVSR
jgi:hypothetical protein